MHTKMKAIGFPRISIGKGSSEHIYRIPEANMVSRRLQYNGYRRK